MIRFNNQISAKPFDRKKDEVSFSKQEMKEAIDKLYVHCNASPEDHFVFTFSGIEAINQVIFSTYLQVTRTIGKNHFVASQIEDASVLLGLERLQEEFGCKVTLAEVNEQGFVTANSLSEAISPRTALVSIAWANPLTGVLQPIEELSKVCKERGILFHVDATHVIGKGDYGFIKSKADFMTISGEPLHAPAGTGLLWIKDGIEVSPLIVGGYEQSGLRAGHFSASLWMELCKAIERVIDEKEFVCTEIARLKYAFESYLCKTVPEAKVLFEESERVPHITSIDFPTVCNDALLFYLEKKKLFAVRGGNHTQRIENVLKASKIDSRSALSFGISCLTTEEEIIQAVSTLSFCYERLKKASFNREEAQ